MLIPYGCAQYIYVLPDFGIRTVLSKATVDHLVEEGRQIGKLPWCCDAMHQDAAAMILAQEGICGEEDMEETIARRKKEKES